MQAEAGDYDGAIEDLIKARQLSPKSYDAPYNLGLAYYRAGQLQSAARTLDALRQKRDTAELEDLLGDVFEKEGRYLNAVRAYEQATKLNPKEEAYWYDYVLELLLHETFDAALLVAGPASRAFPSSLRLRVALGVAYYGSGHYDQALGAFMSTSKQFPNQGLPLYFLALASQMTGKEMQPTTNLVSSFMKTHPDEFWPYYFLACQEYQSELQNGKNDFENPIELGVWGAMEQKTGLRHHHSPRLRDSINRSGMDLEGLGESFN